MVYNILYPKVEFRTFGYTKYIITSITTARSKNKNIEYDPVSKFSKSKIFLI